MLDVPATLEALNYLQACDLKVKDLQRQMAAYPVDIKALQEGIQALRDDLESKKQTLREHEVRKKDLENEIASAETTIAKYRNQQLTVKKNEEYKALEHEIATLTEKVGDFETSQLEVMEAIDEESAKVKRIQSGFDDEIEEEEDKIEDLHRAEKQTAGTLEEAEKTLQAAQEEAGTRVLRLYDQISRSVKRPPFIVPLDGDKCSGCHLKVSNDVLSSVRQQNEIAKCGNCGRIVFYVR